MQIKLLGWGYENIRRFKKLDINLVESATLPPHVSLIMMRNGTGKTTTITLIRAVLSEAAKNWSPERIREFRPARGNATNGCFYMKICFGSDIYHYSLHFDYEQGIATYETSKVGTPGGLHEGRTLPMELQGVLDNEEFVNRFVFDGEQARKTLSSGNQEAEKAIEYLYQINELDNLVSKINELVKRKQEASPGATSQSVRNHRTRMEKRKKTLDSLIAQKDIFEKELLSNEEDTHLKEERRRELIASNEQLREEQDKLENQKTHEASELRLAFSQIRASIVEPFQVNPIFDQRLQELTHNMQTLKLPKTTASEFFKELSESPKCICGRSIGPAEKAAILKNSEEYLGEEDLVAINAIKDKLKNYKATDTLRQGLANMVHIKNELRDIDGALACLALQLGEEALEEIDEIQKCLQVLAQNRAKITSDLGILNAPLGTPHVTEQNNIATVQNTFKESKSNYLQANGTYTYTQKAEKTISYITKVRSVTLEKLKATIVAKTNEKISKILTDEPIIIDKIEGNLVLHDRKAVSEGQTLGIAYAYIGSLFEHSLFEFPFIVDSPAASMDLDVRREVASIVPILFKQLVVFVTSGEVAGFAEKFYTLNDVLYATIEGSDEKDEAICTFGKEYFSKYQCEE